MIVEMSRQVTSEEADQFLGTKWDLLLSTAEDMIHTIIRARNESGRPNGVFTIKVSFEIPEGND